MPRGVKPEFDEWRRSVALTKDQEQLILGSTLGNMSIFRTMHRSTGHPAQFPRVGVSHVEANRDYVEWKFSVLGDLTGTPIRCRVVNQSFPAHPEFKGSTMCEFRTFGLPALRPIFDMCYSDDGRRKITREWMEAITCPIALAAWFMDCGIPITSSWHVPGRIQITVPRSDYAGAELVREVLLGEGCGIDAVHLVQDLPNTNIRPAKGHHSLSIGKKEDIREFLDLVEPFVRQVPSMMWKIEPLLKI